MDVLDSQIESVAARTYRILERAIVTLDLAPGTVTTEGALAQRVGAGRTPLREAIQRLAWEGLVEVRPRAGLAIAALHGADWLRVIDARAGLEIVLARSAARHAAPATLGRLQDAAESMHRAVMAADVVAFLEADKALDEAMAQAADNDFAARVVAPLQTHSRRFWFRYRRETGLAESAARHVELIKAILDREQDAAAAAAARLMDLLRSHAEEAARP